MILKKINDSYLLERGSGFYGSTTLEIDGRRYQNFTSGWLESKPKEVFVITTQSDVIGYGDLTVEQFNEKEKTFADSWSDEGYPKFDTLEREFEYRKFLETHPVKREDKEVKILQELIEFDITGKTDNPYIVPYRFIGKDVVKGDDVLYRYSPVPYKMLQEVAKELGLEEVLDVTFGKENTAGMKFSVPSHSRDDLNFVKLNGRYCDYKSLPKFYSINPGTYEECKKTYDSHVSAIREMLMKEIKLINAKGEEIDKAKVIEELRVIASSVANIDAKKSSVVTPFSVNKRIKDFIDKI